MKKPWKMVSVRDLVFVILLFGLTVLFSMCESANLIKVNFGDEVLAIHSSDYSMNIAYTDIASMELVESPVLGTPVDGKNNDALRSGVWQNDIWGEYHLCFDTDANHCIAVHLDDGRTFVFNRKDDQETKAIYDELLTYLPK